MQKEFCPTGVNRPCSFLQPNSPPCPEDCLYLNTKRINNVPYEGGVIIAGDGMHFFKKIGEKITQIDTTSALRKLVSEY